MTKKVRLNNGLKINLVREIKKVSQLKANLLSQAKVEWHNLVLAKLAPELEIHLSQKLV